MTIDDLPDQLKAVDGARAVLNREIEKARAAVNALNSEKATAQAALSQLQDQLKQARVELDAVVADLDRASNARRSDRELAKARTELERLKGETAKESKSLEALTKKRTEAETRVAALENDARLATAERCRAQETVEAIRNKLAAFGG